MIGSFPFSSVSKMSDAQLPCPICHLAFKTEAKVSQHVEKCLASQEREERSSRSRNSNNSNNNNNKRRADDDDDDADVTSLTRNDSKRSRKEDQVAAWSGLGLLSPSSADIADKPLKGKTKKSSFSSGGGAASLAVKIPPAKKSVTNGKKNSEKKIGKEKSETGGNFAKEI